jgi:hypothetical protein
MDSSLKEIKQKWTDFCGEDSVRIFFSSLKKILAKEKERSSLHAFETGVRMSIKMCSPPNNDKYENAAISEPHPEQTQGFLLKEENEMRENMKLVEIDEEEEIPFFKRMFMNCCCCFKFLI